MRDQIEPQAYRRRGEAFWRRALAAQRESGWSQQGFCDRHGLARSTFLRWQRRLGADVGPQPQERPEFVELVVKPEVLARPEQSAANGEAGFELSFESGIRLRLPAQVEGRALAEVLWALKATELC